VLEVILLSGMGMLSGTAYLIQRWTWRDNWGSWQAILEPSPYQIGNQIDCCG
jgi:hypothetical protein